MRLSVDGGVVRIGGRELADVALARAPVLAALRASAASGGADLPLAAEAVDTWLAVVSGTCAVAKLALDALAPLYEARAAPSGSTHGLPIA